MNSKNILITGGYGCIGSEATKWLLNNTENKVVICSRKVSEERTSRVFENVDRNRLKVFETDVTDQQEMEQLLSANNISTVVHMAALQTPDCNANRDLGLQINLAGTQNLIEAMKSIRSPIDRFVFASSIAVYGPRNHYPEARVPMNAEPLPVNVYGVWKLAGEHLSRLFHDETGVPTVCLRPGVLYGPGRDAGLTASPTTAMKCVALDTAYEIPFRSRQDYQFAPDVGAAVGISASQDFDGYGCYTLPGHTLETREIVDTIREVCSELKLGESFKISCGEEEVPFICDLDYTPFVEAFSNVPHTSLKSAIRDSITEFVRQKELGWLKKEDLLI